MLLKQHCVLCAVCVVCVLDCRTAEFGSFSHRRFSGSCSVRLCKVWEHLSVSTLSPFPVALERLTHTSESSTAHMELLHHHTDERRSHEHHFMIKLSAPSVCSGVLPATERPDCWLSFTFQTLMSLIQCWSLCIASQTAFTITVYPSWALSHCRRCVSHGLWSELNPVSLLQLRMSS